MDNTIVAAVLTFLGTGTGAAIIGYFINRRKSGVEVSGLKDDQTVEWRDNALHLSEDIVKKDVEIMAALRDANKHAMEKEQLQNKLNACLHKLENCDCD